MRRYLAEYLSSHPGPSIARAAPASCIRAASRSPAASCCVHVSRSARTCASAVPSSCAGVPTERRRAFRSTMLDIEPPFLLKWRDIQHTNRSLAKGAKSACAGYERRQQPLRKEDAAAALLACTRLPRSDYLREKLNRHRYLGLVPAMSSTHLCCSTRLEISNVARRCSQSSRLGGPPVPWAGKQSVRLPGLLTSQPLARKPRYIDWPKRATFAKLPTVFGILARTLA